MRHTLIALPLLSAATLLSFSPPAAHAQLLLPGIDRGFNGGLSSPSRNAPRVFQSFTDDSLLTDVAYPTTLTGISFRLPAIASAAADPNPYYPYPSVDLTFNQYDITLAQPSQAARDANALVSDTFADNMTSPVLVRSGPLTIPAGSLTDNNTGPGPDVAGQEPAEYSFFIPFTTPYLLQPGQDLVVLVRHSGHTQPAERIIWNFDTFAWTSGGRVATGDPNAPSGSLIPDAVTRYAFRMQRLPGDANGDGAVNRDDLALLDRGAALGLFGYANGDFNSDNLVDAADYAIYYNALTPPAAPVFAVPEPATLSLLALSPLLLSTRRRHRS